MAGERGEGTSPTTPCPTTSTRSWRSNTGRKALVPALRRRSQRNRLDWKRMNRLVARWLPRVRILHPWPDERFAARTHGRSPVR